MVVVRMRWYNPRISGFEWREAPEDDARALGLLEGAPDSEEWLKVYGEWRFELGTSIAAALIRVGEAAQKPRGEL